MAAGAAPAVIAGLPNPAWGLGTPPFLDREQLIDRNSNRSTVACQNGIVCASQPLAAMAGIDILKAGGNCIDAAICTNAVLGLMEPNSDGMGGDLFAIIWSQRDQRLYGLNASGRSPYAWNLDEAARRGLTQIPRISPLSWSVPGCVSGWASLSERFGSTTLARCLEPAISYAEEGFPLSPLVAANFERDALFTSIGDPSLGVVYRPNGIAPKFGDIFKNPMLARSYRQVAEGGPEAFYRGEIAVDLPRFDSGPATHSKRPFVRRPAGSHLG